MKKYSVDVTYTATVTYSGTVEVNAKDEDEAETKALAAAEQNACHGWDSSEDGGDYEVQSIDEVD